MSVAEEDHSLTAEEEAEWDNWLQRAKAAEEAAQAQHQYTLQQQERLHPRQQQVTFEDAVAQDSNHSEQTKIDESALSDNLESVDV